MNTLNEYRRLIYNKYHKKKRMLEKKENGNERK